MKKLFEAADRYIAGSDWKTIAVLKFCLISIGMMIGMFIKKEHRRKVMAGTLCVFALTYVPLMARFARVLADTLRDAGEPEE